jgi:hypothetical protein
MTDDLRVEVAARYIHVYERLTGQTLSSDMTASFHIQDALDTTFTSSR